MTNCWSIGIFFAIFLGSFCIWNCYNREELKTTADWYGCFDQQGKPSDFAIIYKLPKDPLASTKSGRDGTAYMHLTPDSASRLHSGGVSSVLSYSDTTTEWILSNYSIQEKYSIPGLTMKRLYNDYSFKSSAVYFMYNDEFPDGKTSATHGHTKGVVVLSESGGFWLIHSVPKYPPPLDQGYDYPETAHRYGQSMLCISLPPLSHSQAENIAHQLIQNEVHIYSSGISDSLAASYPVLKEVLNPPKSKEPPFYRITQIPTYYAKTFTSFAKNKKFEEDLYSNLVAPVLKTSLLVETWRNGPHPLPSTCNDTFKVENIEMIGAKCASMEFATHKDHSKWAVSEDHDKPYVCIGDINRMETQFDRGGGTTCLWSLSIWYRFRNLIKRLEGCPKENLII